MTSAPEKMGFATPSDQKIPVTVRDWNAMKLAVWRSQQGWEIVAREAAALVARCRHEEGCPGKEVESEPCVPDRFVDGVVVEGCPDREQRMSALVILSAARMFAPVGARRPANDPYFAPSREYFSEVLSELAAAQVELAVLRGAPAAQPTMTAQLTFAPTDPAQPKELKELT
jgi:hypothetical protein